MNAAITNTASSIKAIKMIFNWQSREGLHCHCLLRIYIKQNLGRAVIIASELYSNRENTSLTHDLKGLANAIVHSLRTEISVPLSQVTWIVHYGDFSQPHSYENLSFPDEFSLVNLPGNGNELGEGEGEWIVMKSAQLQELLGSINLEPVEQVLAELGEC
jgi:hypothetical protein